MILFDLYEDDRKKSQPESSIAQDLKKLRAQYPDARSDLEAVAKDSMTNTERLRQQISRVQSVNDQQQQSLDQLTGLDRNQEKEISTLDKGSDDLEKQIDQLQTANDRLQRNVKSAVDKNQTAKNNKNTASNTYIGSVDARADAKPDNNKKEKQEPELDRSVGLSHVAQQLSTKMQDLPGTAHVGVKNPTVAAVPKGTARATNTDTVEINPERGISKLRAAESKTGASLLEEPAQNPYPEGDQNLGGYNLERVAQAWEQRTPSVELGFGPKKSLRLTAAQVFAMMSILSQAKDDADTRWYITLFKEILSNRDSTIDFLKKPDIQDFINLYPNWLDQQKKKAQQQPIKDLLNPAQQDKQDQLALFQENTPRMTARERLQQAVDREKKKAQLARTGLTGLDHEDLQRRLQAMQDRIAGKKTKIPGELDEYQTNEPRRSNFMSGTPAAVDPEQRWKRQVRGIAQAYMGRQRQLAQLAQSKGRDSIYQVAWDYLRHPGQGIRYPEGGGVNAVDVDWNDVVAGIPTSPTVGGLDLLKAAHKELVRMGYGNTPETAQLLKDVLNMSPKMHQEIQQAYDRKVNASKELAEELAPIAGTWIAKYWDKQPENTPAEQIFRSEDEARKFLNKLPTHYVKALRPARAAGHLKDQGVAEGKGLAKKVKVVKGEHAGKTGWIREIKHGAHKGAPKTYYIDLDDGGQANNLPATALRLVKDQGVAEDVNEADKNFNSMMSQLTNIDPTKDRVGPAMDITPKMFLEEYGTAAPEYFTVQGTYIGSAYKETEDDFTTEYQLTLTDSKTGKQQKYRCSPTMLEEDDDNSWKIADYNLDMIDSRGKNMSDLLKNYDRQDRAHARLGAAIIYMDKVFATLFGYLQETWSRKYDPKRSIGRDDSSHNNSQKFSEVMGYVAVAFSKEDAVKQIKGIIDQKTKKSINVNKQMDSEDIEELFNKIEFVHDQIEQDLIKLGIKLGWTNVDPGRGMGSTELFFESPANRIDQQQHLASRIVKTYSAIEKYFKDLSSSLAKIGLPAYQHDCWFGMGTADDHTAIDDIQVISNIASGATTVQQVLGEQGVAEGHKTIKGPHGRLDVDTTTSGVTRVQQKDRTGAKRFGLPFKTGGHVGRDTQQSAPGASSLLNTTNGVRRATPRLDYSDDLREEQDVEGVERAILHRIMVGHKDLLLKYGPQKVMQAAEEVAYNTGDISEIGTSDVSGWVQQVEQILGAVSEAKAVKTRLDPACWTGKKIGNPKTKVKNGVRVNNCVPK